jgi:ATPase subunit of ABC transporter with duplicated ATPase domains
VTKGEKIAIVGKNGVGKTTLCRMLMGELTPDAGTITWGHQAAGRLPGAGSPRQHRPRHHRLRVAARHR